MANSASTWSQRVLAVSMAILAMVVVAGVAVTILQPGWIGALTGTAQPLLQTTTGPAVSPAASNPIPIDQKSSAAAPTPTTTPTSDRAQLLAEVRTAEAITNGYWSRHWSDYFPGQYSAPKIVGLYDGKSESVPLCGSTPLPPDNAVYCSLGDYVAWDTGLMEKGYSNGDTWPYLVIAHEWGHAIQSRLGDSLREKADELQADCLAGAALYGAAADGELIFETGDQMELASGLSALGDETPWTSSSDHGDSFERVGAFAQGRLHGIAPCFPQMKRGGWGEKLIYANGIEVSVIPTGYQETAQSMPVGATAGAQPDKFTRTAAVFEVTVRNSGPSVFDATNMDRPIVRYGERGLLAEIVAGPPTSPASDSFGILRPGQGRSIKVLAVIPLDQLIVRVAVPGPDPVVDWSASFEGDLPQR